MILFSFLRQFVIFALCKCANACAMILKVEVVSCVVEAMLNIIQELACLYYAMRTLTQKGSLFCFSGLSSILF